MENAENSPTPPEPQPVIAPASRCHWLLILALLILALVFGGYVCAGPVAALSIRFFEAVLAIWFFAFGASLGSFLNVVAYRIPRGRSLLGSSFCPRCKHSIRWHDNIPAFGWVVLRGRCRDCHQRISGRYPLVEVIAGVMVLGLAVAELFLDGANLPGRAPGGYAGLSWLVQRFPWDQVATLTAHTVLLCVLLSWTLIVEDGYRLPRRFIVFALALGLALPAIAPWVQPVPWIGQRPDWIAHQAWLQRLDTTLVGIAAGLLLGGLQALVPRIWRRESAHQRSGAFDWAASVALVGAFLGWQATVSVILLATSVRVIVSTITAGMLPRQPSIAWACMTGATFFQILAWSALDGLAGWPGSQMSPIEAIAPVTVSLYFSAVASYVECRRVME
jgi:leader peptidase (prepilin peptidase)/N-methyltransferase